jgi:hypothetical protein
MESETEGGILDIHFGINTDVDICRISLVEKNTYDHYKKTVWSNPVDYLLVVVSKIVTFTKSILTI